jgi:hypothetical protein
LGCRQQLAQRRGLRHGCSMRTCQAGRLVPVAGPGSCEASVVEEGVASRFSRGRMKSCNT